MSLGISLIPSRLQKKIFLRYAQAVSRDLRLTVPGKRWGCNGQLFMPKS